MNDTQEYMAGQIAAEMGKSRDSNPFLLPPNPRGISHYSNDTMGGDWARGFRDQSEVIRRAKFGPTPEENASAFRRSLIPIIDKGEIEMSEIIVTSKEYLVICVDEPETSAVYPWAGVLECKSEDWDLDKITSHMGKPDYVTRIFKIDAYGKPHDLTDMVLTYAEERENV